MLVGRADRPPRSRGALALLLLGAVSGLLAALALLSGAGQSWAGSAALACACCVVGAIWLEQRGRRQRAFVFEFDAQWLRLDFSTPLAGRPRTLVIGFDRVADLALAGPVDGAPGLLTVDFKLDAHSPDLLREVLAAYITAEQLGAAERVRQLLRAAVGLDPPQPAAPTVIVDRFG